MADFAHWWADSSKKVSRKQIDATSLGQHWVKMRTTHIEQSESALALIADMRADMDFCRYGPSQADISSILTVRALGRCKPVAQSLTEAAVPNAI